MDRVNLEDAQGAVAEALAGHREAIESVSAMVADIALAADLIADSIANGRQLLTCGNGGSAADAQHIAAEFVGRFLRERMPCAALALNANTSVVTAVGNDYGFDLVFARQVQAHGRSGDVLLAISTTGSSPNILAAIDAARERGMSVIGLCGHTGGAMAGRCDVCLTVASPSTPRIQEAHILIGHILCGLVENTLP